MHRLIEKNGWLDISCATYITFEKKYENFNMVVNRHVSNKTWILTLEDNIDDADLNTMEPEEVIIDFDVTYEFVEQFDLLLSNFKNFMRLKKLNRISDGD